MFFLLYGHTDDGVFHDFPKTSDHFPTISEDSPKLVPRSHKRCPTFSEIFQRYPKIAEDFRGRPEDVSIIHQRIEVQFKTNLVSAKTSEDVENNYASRVPDVVLYEFYEWCIFR